MSRQVALPDGRTLDIPDDVSPGDLAALKTKLSAQFPDHAPEMKAQRDDFGKDAGPPIPENNYRHSAINDFNDAANKFVQGALTGGHSFADTARGVDVVAKDPSQLQDLAEQQFRSMAAPAGGDVVAALGSAVTGKGFNPAQQRARREDLETKFGPAAKMIPEALGAAGVATTVAKAPLGVAGSGAVTGAVTGANESGGDVGDTLKSAAFGAAGGKLAQILGSGIANGFSVLAKRVKEPGETVAQAAQRLMADFQEAKQAGAPTDLPSLVKSSAAKRLALLAQTQPAAGKIMTAAEEANTAAQPGRMQASIAQGKDVTGSVEMIAQRKDAFDTAMKPIENKAGLVNPSEAKLLMHPDVQKSLDDVAKQKLLTAIQNNKPAFLTVRDMDTVRRTLASAVKAAQRDGANYQPLVRARTTARMIGERIAPEYKAALADYEGRSDMAKAAAVGEKIQSASPGDLLDAAKRLPAQGTTGLATGARKTLSEAAGESQAGAYRTAKELQTPGMKAKAAAAFDQSEADRLATVGKFEQRNAENYATMAPKTDEQSAASALKSGIDIATAATGGRSPWALAKIAKAATDRFTGFGLTPGMAKSAAKLLTSNDPAKVQLILKQLERVGLRQEAVALMAKMGGATAGVEAAQ